MWLVTYLIGVIAAAASATLGDHLLAYFLEFSNFFVEDALLFRQRFAAQRIQ